MESAILSFLILPLLLYSHTHTQAEAQAQAELGVGQPCPSFSCNHDNETVQIQFPFWVPDHQSRWCGYDGYVLSCRDNKTFTDFAGFDLFHVRKIDYRQQLIWLSDPVPGSCFPNRAIELDNILSTYKRWGPAPQLHFDILNCSKSLLYERSQLPTGVSVISCLSHVEVWLLNAKSGQTYEDMKKQWDCVITGSSYSPWWLDISNMADVEKDRDSIPFRWIPPPGCGGCVQRGMSCGFVSDSGAVACFPRPWASRDKKGHVGAIVGSILGFSALLGFVWTIHRQGKRLTVGPMHIDGPLVQFQYKQLRFVTDNFREKLGSGSFGSVFRGILSDSSFIAVKMLQGARQGDKQFRAEVNTIGNIQHLNLARLFGFCAEGDKRLLVYEYMPNGSLNTHLFRGKDFCTILSWKTRYQIALGTAKGLAYLHHNCRDCIIHCDMKPENILLDADFCPKIADFGLAKLMKREFSRVLTTIRGTIGYLAPEWLSGAAITSKADVYSYGMVLFELISGRRNTEEIEDEEFDFFPATAISKISQGEDVLSIVDKKLEGNADSEEVMRLCKLACWCVQNEEYQRPTMGQVVHVLEGITDVNMLPMPQSFQMYADNQSQIIRFTIGSTPQVSPYGSPSSSLLHSASSYVTAISRG